MKIKDELMNKGFCVKNDDSAPALLMWLKENTDVQFVCEDGFPHSRWLVVSDWLVEGSDMSTDTPKTYKFGDIWEIEDNFDTIEYNLEYKHLQSGKIYEDTNGVKYIMDNERLRLEKDNNYSCKTPYQKSRMHFKEVGRDINKTIKHRLLSGRCSINVKTKEQMKNLMIYLQNETDIRWSTGGLPTDGIVYWEGECSNTVVSINKSGGMVYDSMKWYKGFYPDKKIYEFDEIWKD